MAEEPPNILSLIQKSVRTVNRSLQDVKESYVSFVNANPETVTQVEKTIKALSYAIEFIPRNYENSIFLTELLNSANSMFAYVNDCILCQSQKLIGGRDSVRFVAILRRWLHIVECVQAFFEMTASRLGGRGAKWAIIVVVSLVKATLRLVLLYQFKSGIQTHPVIKSLPREEFMQKEKEGADYEEDKRPFVNVGKRTGHTMRSLAHSPPMYARTWVTTDFESSPNKVRKSSFAQLPAMEFPTTLTKLEQAGETLHIIRPFIHLISVSFFGTSSVVPWLAALITDASSHTLLSSHAQNHAKSRFSETEQRELQRRTFIMLFYFLRSPIYDRYTKTYILKILQVISGRVPLARFVMQPLARYLPVWQRVYFYSWAE